MSEPIVRLVAGAACALLAVALTSGCSGDPSQNSGTRPTVPTTSVTPPEVTAPADTSPVSPSAGDAPEVRSAIESAVGAADRPTMSEAKREVLRVARETYPNANFKSAGLRAMGRDSQGRWWVQAWTPSDYGESEQWFLIRAANGWVYVTSGTGIDRGEMPSDIAWEDVP